MTAAETLGGVRARCDELIEEYRSALHDALDDLTEEEARLRLVPSRTTLLGLLKHVTFVEGVWCDQAVTGRSTEQLGEVVSGRGKRVVWALHLQVLRELAQHCGHADILREQVLARRGG